MPGVGVTPIQQNLSNALNIGNASIPKEGPKAIPYNFNFQLANSYLIDINFLYQNKIISVVQVFYCDNSANTAPVSVLVQQTNQLVKVPPGAEGYFAVLCPSGGTMTVSSGGAASVPFYLINVPIDTNVWYPAQTAQAFAFDGAGNLKINDQTLAPLIQTIGASPGLDVNVISGGSSGPPKSTNIGAALITANGSTNVVPFPGGAKIINVTGIDISMVAGSTCAAAQTANFSLKFPFSSNQLIWGGTITVPAAGAGQGVVPIVTISNPFTLVFPSDGNDEVNAIWGGTAFTAGGINVNIWGYSI